MFKVDYNPAAKRWQERIDALPPEKRRMVEEFIASPMKKEDQFLEIKRTRRAKKIGDVFVCTLNGIVYYYGKILQANIVNKDDPWINGCLQVSLFKEKTLEKTLDNFKGDYNNLIGEAPAIITSQYWSMGWFETIGNVPLTEEDRNLDCGYFKSDSRGLSGSFYTVEGKMLDHFPKYFSIYGITTLSGIYDDFRIESIIDPSMLTME